MHVFDGVWRNAIASATAHVFLLMHSIEHTHHEKRVDGKNVHMYRMQLSVHCIARVWSATDQAAPIDCAGPTHGRPSHELQLALHWRQAYLVEIEDEVQLANIPKVPIEHLDKVVHHFKCDQLIIAGLNAHDKVQASIALVHNLRRRLLLDLIPS